MYKHIMAALDGSPLAEQALPHAVELAKALQARLTLFSSVEPYVISMPAIPAPVPAYNIDTDMEALVSDREQYLKTLLDALDVPGLNADKELRTGRPADEILNYAKEGEADLIVMTTHGRSGLSRFIYGSVAERVLHGSEVPVLLVRVHSDEEGESELNPDAEASG